MTELLDVERWNPDWTHEEKELWTERRIIVLQAKIAVLFSLGELLDGVIAKLRVSETANAHE